MISFWQVLYVSSWLSSRVGTSRAVLVSCILSSKGQYKDTRSNSSLLGAQHTKLIDLLVRFFIYAYIREEECLWEVDSQSGRR